MRTRAATAQVAAQTPTRLAASTAAKPLLVFPGGTSLKTLKNASGLLSRAWKWIREHQAARTDPKRLRMVSSVSLGEKRFAAVLQVDGLEFLVGGGATNVSLLAQLKGDRCFGEVLQESITTSPKKPVTRRTKSITKPAAAQKGSQA